MRAYYKHIGGELWIKVGITRLSVDNFQLLPLFQHRAYSFANESPCALAAKPLRELLEIRVVRWILREPSPCDVPR